eukprot:gene3732-6620_t
MKKVVFVLIDGLADLSVPNLNNETPLKYSKTPNMDKIAYNGLNGLMDPVEPGLGCGSDTAHLSIFGYDPRTYYEGRGSFETMGAGLDMKIGDIAFKSNFATLEGDIVTSRRADRNFENIGPKFCHFLNEKMKERLVKIYPEHEIKFKYSTEHRCGIRIRGPNLSNKITNTDPLKDNLPLLKSKPKNDSKEALFSSKLINDISRVISEELTNHEINKIREKEGKTLANIILFRGCGVRINAENFEKRHQLKSFMIAPTAIIKGLGMTFDMKIVNSKGGTGDYHTDLNSKRVALIDTFKNNIDLNFGFLHVKAVDDAGHDKNLDLKIEFIEKIDLMIGDILNDLKGLNDGNFLFVVTGDHSTPVLIGDHSYEPVPFSIWDLKSDKRDSVECFSEIEAAKGNLGRFSGLQVMKIIKSFLKFVETTAKSTAKKKFPFKTLIFGSGLAYLLYKIQTYKPKENKEIKEHDEAVEEIIEKLKKGYEAETADKPKGLFHRLISMIQLSFRVLLLSLKFTPIISTYPLTFISESYKLYWYELLVSTFRSCGATFVKLGQWIATRPDIFDPYLANAMKQLHYIGNVHSFEETKEIIQKAFGKDLDDIFVDFDEVPIASGAIAQVYKAKLKNDVNIEVAVKIRHPGIEKTISQDLQLLKSFANFVGQFSTFKPLNLEGNITTFSRTMIEQIDLKVEADNLEQFIENFKEIDSVTFPKPIHQFCHPLVLVETWEQGTPIGHFINDDVETKPLRTKLASIGIVLYLKMLIDNFLHGDLHPGNIFVKLDKNNNPSLVVLDVGMVAKLKETDRKNLMRLFTSVIQHHGEDAAECLIEKNQITKGEIPLNIQMFKQELGEFFDFLADLSTPQVEMGKSFSKCLELGRKHNVKIDPTLATALVGSCIIEGMGRQLNPHIDFIKESAPKGIFAT